MGICLACGGTGCLGVLAGYHPLHLVFVLLLNGCDDVVDAFGICLILVLVLVRSSAAG